MKQEKGFTLIEVLGVIIILSVILAITVPTMIGIMDRAKENNYKIQINGIVQAAKNYVAKNSYRDPSMQEVGAVFEVTLETLNQKGEIELPIKNPRTDENFDPTIIGVKIKKQANGLYNYCFYDPNHEEHLCAGF